MASPGFDIGHQQHSDTTPEPAFQEAQKWIEAVTGRRFGDKDFRGGLENGILLCELLSSIKPGLVKKINRLPTPIAGLDNLTLFLRGCEELGLKGSQLFDPGDLQDTSIRANLKGSDCSRKLKNVLITIYWLGKAANSCASYSGPTLDLKEFEGLLTQMRKEVEDGESPKRSIRDSGYIDCWDSERSDSLSPPRHGRDDSFDSLDSFGSRSQQSPSPDVVVRGSSDGRGSDSESDAPHRKLPDMRKDDMLARRTSCSEPRTMIPFNQYLPNKSNQSAYMPAPLRKKRAEQHEECRKSWSTATSPIGGERSFRSVSMIDVRCEEEALQHPHSQARHELMHNQYNQLREEEDHWQDDLARWKSRRRSISQDLIKKEEERKMMERLMSDDETISQRRKSIKTYREIVEEKERRERELHEAYRKARTPEEAASVLQRYAQRFTISEAVLERLHLPKLLDRSVSVDPSAPPLRASSASPTREPNPMKYLRQQSLPAAKFTSTVEAMVGLPQAQDPSPNQNLNRAGSPERSPTRPQPSKALPLLAPKPYSQPRNSFSASKPVQVDSMLPVNGETDDVFAPAEDSGETVKEGRDSLSGFQPSPAGAATCDSAAKASAPPPSASTPPPPASTPLPLASTPLPPASTPLTPASTPLTPTSGSPRKAVQPKTAPRDSDARQSSCARLKTTPSVSPVPPNETTEDTQREEATPTQPTSQPTELQRVGVVCEEGAAIGHLDVSDGTAGGETTDQHSPLKEEQHVEEKVPTCASSVAKEQNAVPANPAVTELIATDSPQHTDTSTATQANDVPRETAPSSGDGLLQAHPSPNRANPPQGPPGTGVELDSAKAKPQIPATVLNLPKRSDHFSWDPNEERRRQERWQQEQDRMLQEKYRREQEKLKQEWERAQREVEEEERKYLEEEQKILEETVAPLTPRSPAPLSPGCVEKPPLVGPQDGIVRSLADWERKQELLERQARGVDRERGEKRPEHPDWSEAVAGQSTAARNDCRVTESSQSLSSSQTEAIAQAQQNGQRSPTAPQLQFLPGETSSLTAPSWNNRPTKPQGEEEVWRKTASLDRNWNAAQPQPGGMKRSGSYENLGANPSQSSSCSSDVQPQSPNRSVSGKKLCSSCGHPLGKGAAMIIETLSLYFHIQCFKCGICKGQLGDTSAGTDVRIRSGLLNCHQCYIRSRSAGQPTTL
ncbi:LIM and calponin homology domains-containing protein 1-like isoform X5 [Conger conger]|uniref:LIM and calponin homology domains-containing protein 1-like isoform X5 n=1 Tax=Conger conger TaxID=82655 RepID=UPI002A59C90C|nr:LIM and calponin homology domains-containing protein 1-like isoform X5 [Conger conger]